MTSRESPTFEAEETITTRTYDRKAIGKSSSCIDCLCLRFIYGEKERVRRKRGDIVGVAMYKSALDMANHIDELL